MTFFRRLYLFSVATVVGVAQLTFGMLPSDIERAAVSAREGVLSHQPSSSSRAQQIEAQLAGHQPLSWERMVTTGDMARVNPYAPQAGIELHASKMLDKEMRLLQEDSEHIARHPYRQLTQVEVRGSLDIIMKAFLDESGWKKAEISEAAWPYDGRASLADFGKFLEQSTKRGLAFGMWPIQLGERRLLVSQLSAQTREFQVVNGFNTATKNYVYLGVWQEVGPPGSRLFQYLGAFYYPNPRRFHSYKAARLRSIAKGVERMRMWGSSLMYVKFMEDARPPPRRNHPSLQ